MNYTILQRLYHLISNSFRERDILKNLASAQKTRDDGQCLVYRFTDKKGNYFDYEVINNRITA